MLSVPFDTSPQIEQGTSQTAFALLTFLALRPKIGLVSGNTSCDYEDGPLEIPVQCLTEASPVVPSH